MKILIITQKVDRADAVLGFVHRWIEMFATQFEQITVICLERGESSLPDNVRVFSLGKEQGATRSAYIRRFFKIIWEERRQYRSVFIHMNEEYLLLAGWLWKLLGKKVVMWRNHPAGSWRTHVAAFLCDRVLCTSEHSYTARFRKTKLMPVGIDTDYFMPSASVLRPENSVLYVGRIAPVKKVDVLLGALLLLREQGIAVTADIIGPSVAEDLAYRKALQDRAARVLALRVRDAIPYVAIREEYLTHQVFVNLSPDGMYDKVIFEAMASGALVLVSNTQLIRDLGEEVAVDAHDATRLAAKLGALLVLAAEERAARAARYREYVVQKHSLRLLVRMVQEELC